MITTNDLEQFMQKIDLQGWTHIDLMTFDPEFVQTLYQYHQHIEQRGLFKSASITENNTELQKVIRNDYTYWLEFNNDTEKLIQQKLDLFLNALHDYFRIGLTHYESHLALYPSGHFYKTHIDQTRENNKRFFSFVIYLNKNWSNDKQGEIVGYTDPAKSEILFKMLPTYGQMILFQSHIPHEVITSKSNRRSLTGWFRK